MCPALLSRCSAWSPPCVSQHALSIVGHSAPRDSVVIRLVVPYNPTFARHVRRIIASVVDRHSAVIRRLWGKPLAIQVAYKNGAKPLQTSTSALATSAAISDPVMKAPITNTLQLQAKHKRHQLPQVRKAIELSKGTMVNPRPYLSKTKTDDDGSYSATLGLKDEFNNDWMK